ncbi:MAG TPA: transglycosylase domain-containing protein, partial [Pyrinomonadaceae bacterium]|nr:transglycosylase domain-containing protein [Pyrinomonadaceae bacterium]
MWRFIRYVVYAGLGIFVGGLIFEAVTLPSFSDLATQNPATTSLIEARNREARRKAVEPKRFQVWVPLERISPNLQRAVIAGEDSNFATHNGFDYEAIQRAWEHAQKEAEKDAKQTGENDS